MANRVGVLLVAILFFLLISPALAALPSATNDTIVGIKWNTSSSSTVLQWIDSAGNPYTPAAGFFDSHKIWGNMWRCTINTTTNALTFGSNARGDGLDLTGASGPVMTIVPKFYTKAQVDGSYLEYWASATPQAGYTIFPAFVQRGGTERDYILIGSYEGSFKVDSTTGVLYLDSVTGRQPWTGGSGVSDGIFRLGFDTGTGLAPTIGQIVTGDTSTQQGIIEGVYKSGGTWGVDAAGIIYLSRPYNVVRTAVFTNTENLSIGGGVFAKVKTATANANYAITMTNLQDFADNYGSGWGVENFWTWNANQLLFYTEYGNLNSQSVLGRGITDKASGIGFTGNNTGINSADSNVATTGTGSGTGTNGLTPVVYRGIENIWGNVWKYVIGFNSVNTAYRVTKRDGTGALSETLVAGQYETSTAVPLSLGVSPFYVYGYATQIETEDLLIQGFVPKSVTGGSSSTYLTDYGYSHYYGQTNILLAGGTWDAGGNAGVAYRYSAAGVGDSYRPVGARPEFIGTTNTTGMTNADFTTNTTSGMAPLTIQFTDTTTGVGAYSWNWSFGDGSYSTSQNPIHTYSTIGSFNVSLIVTNVYNGTDTETKTNLITVYDTVAADFSGTPTSGSTPLTVQFTDASTTGGHSNITSWAWTFGDGGTSILQSPAHTYITQGLYSVNLSVSNGVNSSYLLRTNYINATSTPGAPTANFHGTPTTGYAPLIVTFFDDSTGSPTSWNWSFGDGTYSNLQNPAHTYTVVGLYTVSLNATNGFGSDVFLVNDYINVTAVATPTPTPSNTSIGTRVYGMEETFVPFWLWAVIIILGSALLLIGLFGQHLIFGILSMMCFSASAFTSPVVGFFYQETILADSATQSYYVFPLVWQVIQPWMAWLLWGMALTALLVMVYGIISGMVFIKKPGDEFLEDGWLDKRDF